eukprot:2361950-Lingulodinium_polyedra.AAC.1
MAQARPGQCQQAQGNQSLTACANALLAQIERKSGTQPLAGQALHEVSPKAAALVPIPPKPVLLSARAVPPPPKAPLRQP